MQPARSIHDEPLAGEAGFLAPEAIATDTVGFTEMPTGESAVSSLPESGIRTVTVIPGDAALVARNKELSALVTLAETISRSLDLHTILNDALDKVLEIVAMEGGEVFILDPETDQLLLRASRGVPVPSLVEGSVLRLGDSVPGVVARAAKPIILWNVESECPEAPSGVDCQAPRALAGIPLLARGHIVGVMLLSCRHICPPTEREACGHCINLTEEDMSLLLAMGQQIGMAVENARLWEELKRKEKNRAHLLKRVIAAQEEERRRIARELHDGAGQALTSLMIGLKRLQSAETPEEARRLAAELRATAAGTLDEVHTLALELRPSVLDDMGLSIALQRYCQDYARRTGITVDCRCDEECDSRLPGSVEIAIYRIVQEALTNVAKHASANNVSVLLRMHRDPLRAIIADDGVGFDVAATLEDAPDERKLGLVGMQERAGLLGGACTFESRPGDGCTIFVEVPIPREGGAYE